MPTIPYVSQTWTDGVSQASAARMMVIEQGITNVSFAPAVRVFHNAAQSITTATSTALAFNSERFDQAANVADTMHDTATNNSRLTCRYAGVYQVSGCVEWAGNATGNRELGIRHSVGSTFYDYRIQANLGAGTVVRMGVSSLIKMDVNEYVELVVRQDSGAGLNVNSTGNLSPEFMMVRVG